MKQVLKSEALTSSCSNFDGSSKTGLARRERFKTDRSFQSAWGTEAWNLSWIFLWALSLSSTTKNEVHSWSSGCSCLSAGPRGGYRIWRSPHPPPTPPSRSTAFSWWRHQLCSRPSELSPASRLSQIHLQETRDRLVRGLRWVFFHSYINCITPIQKDKCTI